jgi:phospholipid-binding lipoprotein MlaA
VKFESRRIGAVCAANAWHAWTARGAHIALLAALCLVMAGCSDMPSSTLSNQTDANDPWESMNRQVFAMNQEIDHSVLLPIARGYVDVVPEPARDGVHNALSNFDAPVVFANDILQGEFSLAVQTVGRFGLNSTLGLGGLIDVATPAGISYHSADFGQTLGVWGVGDGPYLVLPLLGPDNPRDLAGLVADTFMDPLIYVGIRDYTYWGIGEEGVSVLDLRARNIGTIEDIERSSLDLYVTERSLYRQYRNNHIQHGKLNAQSLPKM